MAQPAQMAMEREHAIPVRLTKKRKAFRSKEAAEYSDRQEETGSAGNPARAVCRQTSGGYHTV